LKNLKRSIKIENNLVTENIFSTTSIRANIPVNTITIYGYTSPNSRIELNSPKVYSVTYSREDGFFIFDHLDLPRHSQDLCLISIDESNRVNNPVCFPEPPPINTFTEIGSVLLSPTISLDLKNSCSSGQTIPNTSIQVFLYQQSSPFSFIKKVQAFSIPVLETTSDSRGNYSLNIPITSATNYRIFLTTKYLDTNSPKSNTLLYHPGYTISLLYLLIPLILIIIALYFIFKKPKQHFYPMVIYNKTISPL